MTSPASFSPAGRYDLDGVREASVGQIFRRLLVLLDGVDRFADLLFEIPGPFLCELL